ncbi:MAG: TonB-dependent receptor [Deltaproteobacteria bacterium]|jgi:long-chain fatty acid transport protein|nr:TonB-dependent receptor [Deltaproteobacteria bacterium]MBW2541391.1 TonB-dependent receptor [Deltaproteobacteria bacterium]
MKRLALSARVGLALATLLLAGSSHAGGLYLSSFGDPSMGNASAGSNAVANDASTAHTNPAGMTRLDDHGVLMGLAPGFSTVEFSADGNTPAGGGDGGDQGGFIPITSTGYVHKLSERWRLGMSLLSFAGASLDPKDDWAGRFETTEVTLFSLTFLPTVAVQLTDWLSLGAGAAVTYGMLDMKVRTSLPLREPTIWLDELDDWVAAPVVSLLVEPTPKLRFGVVYWGESDFELDGKVRLPSGLPASLVSLELNLPLARAVRVSAYWDATEEIALMMSSGWEDWSTAKSLPVSGANVSASVPLKFRDTWYLAAGVNFKVSDAWTLQTGLRYDSSALKNRDRTAALPVDRFWTLGIGGLYDYSDKLKIGLGFSWSDLGNAPINNATVRGKYTRNEVFLFNLSFNWKKLPWSGLGTF